MTIKFRSDNPQALLAKFKKLINQREADGKIKTWEEQDGGFVHTSEQGKGKGRFEASISVDGLYLIFSLKKSANDFSYAYYHGHLLQAFIEHLSAGFDFSRYVDGRNK